MIFHEHSLDVYFTSPLLELCCLMFVLLLTSNIWLVVRVLRPIHRLSAQASELNQGNFTAINKACGGIPEIEVLRRSMASMVRHVRRSQLQSMRYADNLTEGQEAERLRIARELHDDTIQSLVAISQNIDMAKTWLSQMPEQAENILREARKQSVEAINNIRHLIEDLRPPALEELGFITALNMQVEQCTIPVSIQVKGHQRRLDEERELALFRVAQEGIANAKRHAQASKIEVQINYQPDMVSMSIIDDGLGFSPPQYLTNLADSGHYGLMGIQERVNQLGGYLSVGSVISQGTTLDIEIPAQQPVQPHDAVRDPVCSAIIEPQQVYASTQYYGVDYFFCCPICQGAFKKEPEKYLTQISTS